jgi:hypothetical protein
MSKLKLSNYFDWLLSELDLSAESSIRDNIKNDELVAKFDSQRAEPIKAIRECEAENMKLAPSRVDLNESELFPTFCFLIEMHEKGK